LDAKPEIKIPLERVPGVGGSVLERIFRNRERKCGQNSSG
jgi:hypothetical protein